MPEPTGGGSVTGEKFSHWKCTGVAKRFGDGKALKPHLTATLFKCLGGEAQKAIISSNSHRHFYQSEVFVASEHK